MTRPAGGEPARRNRWQVVLRGFWIASSVGLGAFAVWLIVTAETQKGTRVGALIGFWGLLIAAFAVFGPRHSLPALARVDDEAGRPGGELAGAEDAAARREHEHWLTELLRREITATMSAELVTLRAEVAALRTELVARVGGRQLGQLGSFPLGSGSRHTLGQRVQPVAAEPFNPEPVGPRPGPPAPTPLPPEPIVPEPPAPEPIAPEPPIAPVPPQALVREQTTPPPRLRPIPDFEVDPVEADPEADPNAGRRRRRAEGDDVLARILSRESSR